MGMGFRSSRTWAKEWFLYHSKRRHDLPARFFTNRPNVGDALNPYLLERISRRQVFPVRSSAVPHILAVGSILHMANTNSIVWGSGLIAPERAPARTILRQLSIYALRGHATRNLLVEQGANASHVPLGDPAILVPRYYQPNPVKARHRLGVIPHYVDQHSTQVKRLAELDGAHVIDVALPPEPFIDALVACDTVISSSLHGLILADAYGIPNIWARFSNNILGGEFKFLDYYSTTTGAAPECLDLSATDDAAAGASEHLTSAKVHSFGEDAQALLDAFPWTPSYDG